MALKLFVIQHPKIEIKFLVNPPSNKIQMTKSLYRDFRLNLSEIETILKQNLTYLKWRVKMKHSPYFVKHNFPASQCLRL